MKKLIFVCLILVIFIGKSYAIPNPWIDCGDDMNCAAQKAGFSFSLNVNKPSIRAMKGMIEITYPLDKKRKVTARKVQYCDKTDRCDISGVYYNYPVNKDIKLDKITFHIRGKKHKFYVVNFTTKSGCYSFYSKEGMRLKDLKNIAKLVNESNEI